MASSRRSRWRSAGYVGCRQAVGEQQRMGSGLNFSFFGTARLKFQARHSYAVIQDEGGWFKGLFAEIGVRTDDSDDVPRSACA